MTKTYLIVPPTNKKQEISSAESFRLNEEDLLSHTPFETGDKLLRMYSRNSKYEGLIPNLEVIVYLNKDRKFLTLETEKSYAREVPADVVKEILNRPLIPGVFELTPTEYAKIVDYMSRTILEESELLSHIKRYFAYKEFYFEDEILYNYHICLKTRPFVILAGLSGTGKSKLSQLYAEAMGCTVQNKRYQRLAVRPGWNDDRFLLGYLNTITGEYITEPAVDFLFNAIKDTESLYFLCLDEMNLAHVEYYFSQFLSALEEENPQERVIPLLSETMWKRFEESGRRVGVPPSVVIPSNVFFTGTINVDETTQMLSDKVIDRANTIEFFTVNFEQTLEKVPPPTPINLSTSLWQSYIAQQPDLTQRTIIAGIEKILNKVNLGFGYRVLRDVEWYLSNSHNILSPQVALDLQVKQRILPHIRGTMSIMPALEGLINFMRDYGLNRSETRLTEMKEKLERDGYTSFWR